MSMKRMKHLLVLCLALVMVVGLLSVTALAVDTKTVQLHLHVNGNAPEIVTLGQYEVGTEIQPIIDKVTLSEYYNKLGFNDYTDFTCAGPYKDNNGINFYPFEDDAKITGWTNIHYYFTTKEKVVYYLTAEDLASRNEPIYSTEASFGDALPYDAPADPVRDGYKFLYWAREGQTEDVTGQTVNGWTNLYGVWEKDAVEPEPIDPIYVRYKVETYVEQTNGKYRMVDEAWSTAEAGTTVEATVDAPRHYHVNKSLSVLSDTVVVPESIDEIVVLKVYYDRDVYKITYTDNVPRVTLFKDQTYYAHFGDDTPKFKGTPQRKGYKFVGWTPSWSTTVYGSVTYEAKWLRVTDVEDDDECPRDKTCPAYYFTDLNLNLWYHDAIHYCVEEGLMDGVGNKKFAPYGDLSRAMIVTTLYRMEDEPWVRNYGTFRDVDEDAWYADAVEWAAEEGIVKGYGKKTFGPNRSVTVEQLAAILQRYADYKGYDIDETIRLYSDAVVSQWALDNVRWAVAEGLLRGGRSVNATQVATRAEIAYALYNFMMNVAD